MTSIDLSGPEQQTTRVLMREKHMMSRTAEVKQRIGPIMERMKCSLAKIQALEHSLASGETDDEFTNHDTQDVGSDPNGDSIMVKMSCAEKNTPNSVPYKPGSPNSRKLLKNSMQMLKKKLTTLQRMEEALSTSEDRRQNLQHYFLQVSLSKPMLELASTKRKNHELQCHLSVVKDECELLEQRCANMDTLEQKVSTLSQSNHQLAEMERKLQLVEAQNKAYEQDLQDRQSKINKLSIRCDDLDCQVEQLTELCNNLQQQLNDEGRRANSLEIELVRTNCISEREVNGLRNFKSGSSINSNFTAPTDTDADSATVESSSENETKYQSSDDGVLPLASRSTEYDDDLGNSLDSSADSSTVQDDLVNLLGDIETRQLCHFDDDDLSSTLPEGTGAAKMQQLLARIEKLDKENAELRALYRVPQGKLHSAGRINKEEAPHVQENESEEALSSDVERSTGIPTHGSFFGSWRSGPSQPKRNNKAEKARQISEGLAAPRRGKE